MMRTERFSSRHHSGPREPVQATQQATGHAERLSVHGPAAFRHLDTDRQGGEQVHTTRRPRPAASGPHPPNHAPESAARSAHVAGSGVGVAA